MVLLSLANGFKVFSDFDGHKNLNTTMIYARAHDQTIADDYFAAMQRVELRLDGAPAEPSAEIVVQEEPGRAQLLALVEQLSQRKLCFPARLEIVSWPNCGECYW